MGSLSCAVCYFLVGGGGGGGILALGGGGGENTLVPVTFLYVFIYLLN